MPAESEETQNFFQSLVHEDVTPKQFCQLIESAHPTRPNVTLFMMPLKVMRSDSRATASVVRAIGVTSERRLSVITFEPKGFVLASVFPSSKSVHMSGLEFVHSITVSKADLSFQCHS